MDPALRRIVDEIPEGFGVVGLLSSDEFTPPAESFDELLMELAGPRVALLLCADPGTAAAQAVRARDHYGRLGGEPIVFDVLDRSDTGSQRIPDFDVVFIGGGSPSTLVECLRGTPLWQDILQRWKDGRAIAGSSAGAMALCRHILFPEPGADMPTRWAQGIGPLSRFGLAVHATTRPPEWRQQVARSAPVPVVALDDGAGLVLRAGFTPTATGRGSAWVVDPDRG